ncbi:MAG: NUDIX domain-containing protein [Candidatus Woesearchaeota archaeon]|jgi:8-oxo-dGTP pyrophosphatase MutT (NUDIX family)
MKHNIIKKYGLIILKDKKFLINRKKHTTLFLLPGGKPEHNESPEQCLIREIKEEHNCNIVLDSLIRCGVFEDVAANEPNTIIQIELYYGRVEGTPKPSSEIEEQRWFGKNDDKEILSPIIRNKILPFLIEKNFI